MPVARVEVHRVSFAVIRYKMEGSCPGGRPYVHGLGSSRLASAADSGGDH
jgi:hypothetical protein